MFALEKPIALQLACIGSRLMINYGTHATIKIGCKVVEEYFDIANVEHDPRNPISKKNGDGPGL